MIDLFAYIGGVLAMVSFIPQIIKARRTNSTEDLSYLMLATTLASSASYEVYALYLSLWPVVIMNGLFSLTIVYTLFLKWRIERAGG